MVKKMWSPQDQVFWYLKRDQVIACKEDMQVDVVIIGGGIAGLSAAQAWHERGKKVALFEQYFCGSGATGKSSGFVTPNAELSFTDFSNKYTPAGAVVIWNFITKGVEDIRENILDFDLACDYSEQNTLILASTAPAMKTLEIEYKNLSSYGYKTKFFNKEDIEKKITSTAYFGGIEYENTFGMNGYKYCQEMKNKLQSLGVMIFEETPVMKIQDHVVITPYAKITADYIVVCTDRFMPELGLLSKDVYHAQTFLMASQVLSAEQIQTIFPEKKYMAWDTEFIYNYFRVTADNRLLVGGGNFATGYAAQETHNYAPIVEQLTKYITQKFPELDVQFEQVWPGLIGISKDIVPLAGCDKDKPYLFYVSASAGLPIAAGLGRYSAEHLLDGRTDLDGYFSPYRKFPVSGIVQSILGLKMSFILSNLIKKNIP